MLSVLILEDILGILLMVVLSAMAVSRTFEGADLAASLLKLAFCLVLWFLVGIYLIPLFLRRVRRWMNSETMVVVAVGLCFLMVVVAVQMGYSAAFGAFMMGSILAETIEAETIGRLVAPLKDLFGAVFFVSVGMLVDPAVLVEYAVPIVVLTLVILMGQAVFGSGAFLLSGQPLPVAMQCGFSLSQIGEFAFIIASLGVSLGVTSSFLYPVVVAVSIITTFTTPYMIRAAQPASVWVGNHLPGTLRQAFGRHNGRNARHRALHAKPSPASELLRALGRQVAAYFTLSVAVIMLAFSVLLPLSRGVFGHWPGNAVCGLLTLCVAAPFLRAIVMRKNHSDAFRHLERKSTLSRAVVYLTVAVRFVIAVLPVYYVLDFLSPLRWWIHVIAAALIVLAMIASRLVKYVSIRLERTFRLNLNWREAAARAARRPHQPYAGRLLSRNVHIARLELPDTSAWAGRTLADRLEVIGDDDSLRALADRMAAETLRPADGTPAREMHLRRFVVERGTPWAGQLVATSAIRERYRCMVVGLEDNAGTITLADATTRLDIGATVWAVGEAPDLARLMQSARVAPAHAPSAP